MELRLDEGRLGTDEARTRLLTWWKTRVRTAAGRVAPMTRIEAPASGMGEHSDWALLRPDMAAGMGKLPPVRQLSALGVREREAARWTIALMNDCAVCRDSPRS